MVRTTTLFDDDTDDELDTPLLTKGQSGTRPEQAQDPTALDKEQKNASNGDASDVTQAELPSPAPLSVAKDADEERPPVTWWGFLRIFVVSGVSVVAIAASGVAMGVSGSVFVYVAGAICVLVSPLVAVNEVRIANKDSIRQNIDKLREDVNRMAEQNSLLAVTIDDLDKEVRKAGNVEQKLTETARTQGQNVDLLVDKVKENRVLVDQMHKIVRANAFQIIVQTVLRADITRNFVIEEQELPILILRLSQIDYLQINEERFKAEVVKNPTVSRVVEIARGLLDEDLKSDSAVFSISTDGTNLPPRRKKHAFSWLWESIGISSD